MASIDEVYSPQLLRVVKAAAIGSTALTWGGLATFLVDHEVGVALLVAGSVALFTTHLFIGVVSYRTTMRRPWPAVRPLDDDEDEW